MGKSIFAFIVTIIVAPIFTSLGELINWLDLGVIASMATMGAFIIYFNDNKNNS